MKQIAHGIFEWSDNVNMGAVIFPARSLLIESGNGWLLWSPLPIHADRKKEIDEIGEVKWIMAPNPFHHLFVEPATKLWPNAKLLGPENLMQNKPHLEWFARPDEVDFSQIEIHRCHASSKVDEFLLHHKLSQTIVVTDLFFHMDQPQNFMTWLVLKLANAISPRIGVPRVSRLLKMMIKDREAIQQSLVWIQDKAPTRIIPAHGAILKEDPVEKVKQAFRHRFGNDFV